MVLKYNLNTVQYSLMASSEFDYAQCVNSVVHRYLLEFTYTDGLRDDVVRHCVLNMLTGTITTTFYCDARRRGHFFYSSNTLIY